MSAESYVARRPSSEVELPVRFGRMVGKSLVMRQLFGLLERAAASDATVLIEGETGTGKEVSAVAIHENSPRRNGPFIVVDCGAIPAQLLESELFGYEKGAFTGAVNSRMGAFEAANTGTIFLDEIGELSLDLQPKILRALEGRKVKRVGSNNYAPIDVRVIAATNRNLREEVNHKRFRSDLYYRLAVLSVKLPPLRERQEDLPALVDEVLTHLGVRNLASTASIRAADYMAMLGRYRWPGNVRQLRNYLERRVALGESIAPPGADTTFPPAMGSEPTPSIPAPSPVLSAGKIPVGGLLAPKDVPIMQVQQPLRIAREEWNNAFEARYLEALMERHEGNVAAAARTAGVNRVHFYRLLWKHGLRSPDTSSEEK